MSSANIFYTPVHGKESIGNIHYSHNRAKSSSLPMIKMAHRVCIVQMFLILTGIAIAIMAYFPISLHAQISDHILMAKPMPNITPAAPAFMVQANQEDPQNIMPDYQSGSNDDQTRSAREREAANNPVDVAEQNKEMRQEDYERQGAAVNAQDNSPDNAPVDEIDDLPNNPPPAMSVEKATTYGDEDLIGAAEDVFGRGAKGLAKAIESVLKKQGRPNAYIAGREAGGAFIFGLRYGSGRLHHKIEGMRDIFWTGPSIGFDIGGDAAKTFVLVYNLYDTEELFQRFPAGEGAAYFIGGFHVGYVRSGDKVLIPVRLGAGLRLGANLGYMKFSKKQKWIPF